MSELSEKCYSAGWMTDLEYVLWDAVESGPRAYGHGTINEDDIFQLIEKSEKTRSWIVFDDVREETAIPLDRWRLKFADDTTRNKRLLHW
ncbi:MAG: hypothetical protein QM762_14845 [Chryseolinea sp.]